MNTETPENPSDCVTQNRKVKSEKARMVGRISRLVREAGLDYEAWRYICRRVRVKCDLKPPKKPKKLPRVLTADEFRRFYQVVDRAEDVQHALMLRLLFYTGVRVSELCSITVGDVDLEACKVFVDQGKGSKDRFVLFSRGFGTALRTHIVNHPKNRWLFQTTRNSKFSTRRVQQIVSAYAKLAGVRCSPHTFRHQAISWLTRHSGMADAELQLITGHARRETLAIYQHVALDRELEGKYQDAMGKVGL
jgi:integrase/recombinase XerD